MGSVGGGTLAHAGRRLFTVAAAEQKEPHPVTQTGAFIWRPWVDILKTRARGWSSDCLASASVAPSKGSDCLQRNNDVARGSAAAVSAHVWKRNITLHNHWRGNINTADCGEISAALKCFCCCCFFIWFSGFRSDAKLFISRRKIHYSHVIWSFISGLFDQDYTTISVKTSCLPAASPPNSSDLSEEKQQTTMVHWVPRAADLCHVKHLNFAALL